MCLLDDLQQIDVYRSGIMVAWRVRRLSAALRGLVLFALGSCVRLSGLWGPFCLPALRAFAFLRVVCFVGLFGVLLVSLWFVVCALSKYGSLWVFAIMLVKFERVMWV